MSDINQINKSQSAESGVKTAHTTSQKHRVVATERMEAIATNREQERKDRKKRHQVQPEQVQASFDVTADTQPELYDEHGKKSPTTHINVKV